MEITCDFNFDLRCGVYDLQHGRLVQVPFLNAWRALLLVSTLLGFGLIALRRNRPA